MKAIPWTSLAGLAVALALGAVLSPPYEPGPTIMKSRRDAWELPDMPRKPDQLAQGLALSSAPIFDADIAAASAAAATEDPGWRIAAFMRRGNERSILVQFNAPTKAPQQLRVGDKLPNGERITRIDDDQVSALQGNKKVRYGVERRE